MGDRGSKAEFATWGGDGISEIPDLPKHLRCQTKERRDNHRKEIDTSTSAISAFDCML